MAQEAILTKIDGEVNISKSFEFMWQVPCKD